MNAPVEERLRQRLILLLACVLLSLWLAWWFHEPITVVFALGGIFSALLAGHFWHSARARRRVEELTREMSRDLDRLALVARRTGNAVIICDTQRRITWVNEAFERITGYTAAEVIGQSPGRLLQFEGTDPQTVARLRATLDAGEVFKGEILNRSRDGRVYWLDLEIQPQRDGQGTLVGFMALETDISERKKAEAALRASEVFLHNTGRIAGVGGWELDLATGQLRCSEQTCLILDFEPGSQPTMWQCVALATSEAQVVIRQAFAEGLEAQERWDMELAFITAAGRPVWLHVVAEAVFADGGPVSIVGAVQDVTQRRSIEAEAKRNADVLRSAIDAIDEAFVLYDADDRLVFCNERYRDVYPSCREAMVPGARFEDIIRHGAMKGEYVAAVGRVDEWVGERMAAHRAANGTLIQHLDTGRILRIVERKMPDGHMVGFRIDITDLVRAKESAERAQRAQAQFIATISHELRTPLQSITGFSDLGKTFAQGHPQFLSMFTDIHAGGMRMLKLVNGLLDVSKIDGTAGSMELREADVAALAADVAEELQAWASEHGVRMVLPDPLPRLMAQVDGFRFQQVVRNVLANAIRFAPPESGIELAWHDHAGAGIELTVRDHGPGIPPDELEAIFEAFVQSSRTRDGSGGTGLGLAISRKIMAAHGGRISAANAPGGGAVMSICLPGPPRHAQRAITAETPLEEASASLA